MLNAETPLSANIVVADALMSVSVNGGSRPAFLWIALTDAMMADDLIGSSLQFCLWNK